MSSVLPTDHAEPKGVLLVEDDDAVRRSLHLMLRGYGYDVKSYADIGSLIADSTAPSSRFLVADYRLGDGDGIGVLRGLKRNGWKGRAIMITAHASPAVRDAALASGFSTVIEKPLHHGQLLNALQADGGLVSN